MMSVINLAIFIFDCIILWKLFEKAGEDGWKGIIPIYNEYVKCKISNCLKMFYISLVLSVIGIGSLIGTSVGYFIWAFTFDYTTNNVASVLLFMFFIFLAIVTLIAASVFKVIINVKFISCYTDEQILKIVSGIGGFIPIANSISLAIVSLNEKYTYQSPYNEQNFTSESNVYDDSSCLDKNILDKDE